MKLKDIPRTATFAWDQTSSSAPLLVTGAIAGALDENFSDESQLEIWQPDFGTHEDGVAGQGQGQSKGPQGSITVGSRFNRLAWSAPNGTHKKGVIAAGLETGEVVVYDPIKILSGASADDARIFRNNKHTGPVRGLDFNPIQKNLLLTGAVNAELFIYDLNNPSAAPMPPGPLSTKLNEITSLQWNPTVSRVFAASSSSGYTSVWDLKAQKEIVSLQYGGGAAKGSDAVAGAAGLQMGKRRGMSDVCWHPESATRLITASEDDESPIIMLWDLRNTRAPERILSGHHKGVLSVSWCKQDADLLLSCGKDNRTLCWNPQTGEIIGELPATSDWSFQTTWCPRNPDLLATAAFDGHIGIHSLQTTQLPEQPASRLGETASADDVFGALGAQEQPDASASVLSLKQPPKWLRRPVSATFGYGGLLASTSLPQGGKQSVVQLRKVVTEDVIIERAEKLSAADGDKDKLAEFCESRAGAKEGETTAWKALQTLFKANSRDELVQLLGFDKAEVEKRVAAAIKKLPDGENKTRDALLSLTSPPPKADEDEDRAPTPTPKVEVDATPEADGKSDAGKSGFSFDDAPGTPAAADFFSSMAAQGALRNPALDQLVANRPSVAESTAAATVGSRASSVRSESIKDNVFHIYPSGESEVDKLITQALVLGDFASAVDLCLASERYADALLLAVRGGAELLQSTQKAYFARRTTSLPFLRVFQSIVTEDLADIVQNADLGEWRVIFVVICTFAKESEFNNLADQLGQRLQYKAHLASGKDDASASRAARQDATLCYLAARRLDKVVSIWAEEMREEEEGAPSTTRYTAHALALQSFIEKVAVFVAATGYVDVDLLTPTESAAAAEQGARTYRLAGLYDRYYEYADLLATQGLVELAGRYVRLTPTDYKGSEAAGDVGQARERVLRAAGMADVGAGVPVQGAFGSGLGSGSGSGSQTRRPAQPSAYAPAPTAAQSYAASSYTQPLVNLPTVPPIQSQLRPQQQAHQPQQSYAAPAQPSYGYDSPYAPQQSYAPQQPAQGQGQGQSQSQSPYAPSGYGAPNGNAYAPQQPQGQTYGGPPTQPYGSSTLPPPPRGSNINGGGNGADTPPIVPASQRRDLPGWNDAPSLSGPPKRPASAAKEIRAAPIMSPFPMSEQPAGPGSGAGPGPGYPLGGPPSGPAGLTPPPSRGAGAPGVLPPPPKGGPRPPSAQNVARQAQGQPFAPAPAPAAASAPQQPPQGFRQPGPLPPQQQQQQQQQQAFAPPPPAPAQAPPPPRGPPRAGPPPPGIAGPPPPRALSPLGPGRPAAQSQTIGLQQGLGLGQGQGQGHGQARPPSAGPPPPGAGARAGPPPPGRVGSAGPPPPQQPQQQQQQRSPQLQQQQQSQQSSPYQPSPSQAPHPALPQAQAPMRSPVLSPPPQAPTPPVKAQHPAGDRSHIPDASRGIYETLGRGMGRVKERNLPPHLKKIVDDTERRLNILFDALNNETVGKEAVGKLDEIARAISANDLGAALSLHVELLTVATGDVASWAPGVKQLIRLSV